MTIKDKIGKYLLIGLVLFTLAYIAHNLVLLKNDNQVYCLETGLQSLIPRYYRIQDSPSSLWREIDAYSGVNLKDRGIYELFSLPFLALFGPSRQSAVYLNFFFLLLLVFSVYKIGALVKDRYIGLLAVFQLLMYPAIFGFTRIYFTPLANTALLSFAVYCIISSGHFRDLRKVVLLTLCVAVIWRMKIEKAAVYLFVPAALYLAESFKANKTDSSKMREFLRNLLVFILFSTLLSPAVTSFSAFISRIKYYLVEICGTSASLAAAPSPSLLDTALIYLKDLYFIQLGELGFIFLIPGIFFFLKDKARHKAILVLWIAVPYLFHSVYYYFSRVHASYYTIGYLPAFALISSFGIYHILRLAGGFSRLFICAAYISVSLVNYAGVTYFDRQLPFWRRTRLVSFAGKMYLRPASAAEEECFRSAQSIIDKIVERKRKASVVFINHYYMLVPVRDRIDLYNMVRRNTVYIYDFSEPLFNLEIPDSPEKVRLRMKQADLIISGNRFYPSLSSEALKNYNQFGNIYDFRQQVHAEEEAFNEVAGDFVPAGGVAGFKTPVSLFINKKLQDLAGRREPDQTQVKTREGL